MTVTTAIDAAVLYHDNAGIVVGAELARRRARLLSYLVRVFNYVYLYRAWWFRRTAPTVTVTLGATSSVLPAGFNQIGFTGGLYNTATGTRLRYVDMQVLNDLREGPAPMVGSDPDVYSVSNQDTASTFRPYLQVPQAAVALTLKAWMDGTPPTLDESANVGNLKVIPEHWHELVLIPGLRAIQQESKSDARYRDFTQDPTFLAGLQLMVIREKHGDDTPRQLPSFWGNA